MEQYQLWNSSRFWCSWISLFWLVPSFVSQSRKFNCIASNQLCLIYLSLSFVCCYLFINDFKCLQQIREKKEIYQSEIVLKIVGSGWKYKISDLFGFVRNIFILNSTKNYMKIWHLFKNGEESSVSFVQ